MGRVAQYGSNMPRVGDYNALVVYDQIRRSREGISRVEIAKKTGLSAQTISNMTLKLTELGLVYEGEPVYSTKRGRPRTLMQPLSEGGYSIGVHLDPATLSAILMDITGNILHRRVVTTPETAEEVIVQIGEFTRELTALVPGGKVFGIGCAVPGPISQSQGKFIAPPTLPGWDQVPFRQMVEEETGLTTYVQKDSIAALSAELWHRNRGVDRTTLFVYAGFGIGFSTSKGGEIFLGSTGNSGEAGHIKVGFDSAPCSCGRRGCVGKIVEFRYLLEQAIALKILPKGALGESQRDLSDAMDKLADKAKRGDRKALQLLSKAADAVAQAIVIVADFLDATDVVMGGSNIARLSPYLQDALEKEIESYSVVGKIHPIEIHGADFGVWVGAAGGASLVFDEELSPSPSKLAVAAPK